MTDHLQPTEIIPPPKHCSTHHFDCDTNTCRTVTIDRRNGDVHLTVLARDVGMQRIVLSPEQFMAVSIHAAQVSQKYLHQEHIREVGRG